MTELLNELLIYIEKEIKDGEKLQECGYEQDVEMIIDMGRFKVQALQGVVFKVYFLLNEMKRKNTMNHNEKVLLEKVRKIIAE